MNNTQNFLQKRYDPANNRTIYYENDSRVDVILELFNPGKKKITFLDVGCYDGEIAKKIIDKGGKRYVQMHGVDIADSIKAIVEPKGIIYKKCDLNKRLDYSDNFFDYILAGEIIEHIYDTDFFVNEIQRVLKKNGTVIVTTPNFLSLGRRLYYLVGTAAFMEASLNFPERPKAAGHVRFFSKKLLIDYMKKHNFGLMKFRSDIISLPRGKSSRLFAKLFPTLGHSLICQFTNDK